MNVNFTQMEINLSRKLRRNDLVSLAADLGSHVEMHPQHIGEIIAEMLVSKKKRMVEILKREFSNNVEFTA
jgi:hypothetical protein